MKKIITLKKNYEFKNVLNKGIFYRQNNIDICIKKNNKNTNEIGIAVSKKACSAVHRNRIKRVIREIYRLNQQEIKTGYNIIFIWKIKNNFKIQDVNYNKLEKQIKSVFREANLLK